MGQIDLIRTEFKPWQTISPTASSAIQSVAFTGYAEVGDVVDIYDTDVDGNILSVLYTGVTIAAINPNVSITFSGSVDTTTATGIAVIAFSPIDDGQEAIDRLYRRKVSGADVSFVRSEAILSSQSISGPVLELSVADTSFFKAGDLVNITATNGLVTGLTIGSVNVNADAANNRSTIVLTTNPSIGAFTSPFVELSGVTIVEAANRLKAEIDLIDRPIENEYFGVGDGKKTSFSTANLFVAGTSKVYLDGVRKRLGTAGTRASLTQGLTNAQLIYTSLILGTAGNATQVRVVNAAGLTVTVTGTFSGGFSISINSNSGTATSAQIAAALNADAVASRLVQVQYGGDGLGTVVPFAYTALASGLNNGTGDYAEIEQLYNNLLVNTGYKTVSFWILPLDPNRMKKPPQSSEEVSFDYRRALVNV